jgi:FkbM family methyltransferase
VQVPVQRKGRRWRRFRYLSSASLGLDRRLVRSCAPTALKVRFLLAKAAGLVALAQHRPATMRLGGITASVVDSYELGTLQSSLVDVLDDLVAPGIIDPGGRSLVVDVGAHIGQFATAIKLVAPQSRVMSFEPDPRTFARLTANIGSVDGVTLHQVGIGDEDGELKFHRHKLSGMSSFKPGGVGYLEGDTVEIPVRRLDDLLDGDQEVDLLKIDVEGFEMEALRGAEGVLRRARYLLVELSLSRQGADSNLALINFVSHARPDARIMRMGRPLGPPANPSCQDVIFDLGPVSD